MWEVTVSEFKDLLVRLAEVKVPAPSPSFSVFHLFSALEFISEGTVGRDKLAEHLAVGRGAVRTILRRLVGAGLMTISHRGCSLSAQGLYVWEEFERVFPKRIEFYRTDLTPSQFNFAFLVRGCCSRVGSGIEQRDAAIKADANSVVVIVFQYGRLGIKSVSDNIAEAFPEAGRLIFSELQPQDGDVVVIASGDTALRAKHGAFLASYSLI
jgi:hypothetical protein